MTSRPKVSAPLTAVVSIAAACGILLASFFTTFATLDWPAPPKAGTVACIESVELVSRSNIQAKCPPGTPGIRLGVEVTETSSIVLCTCPTEPVEATTGDVKGLCVLPDGGALALRLRIRGSERSVRIPVDPRVHLALPGLGAINARK